MKCEEQESGKLQKHEKGVARRAKQSKTSYLRSRTVDEGRSRLLYIYGPGQQGVCASVRAYEHTMIPNENNQQHLWLEAILNIVRTPIDVEISRQLCSLILKTKSQDVSAQMTAST
jgi:hypothetical protein